MSHPVSHTPKGLRREAEAIGAAFPALLADASQLAATVVLGEHGRRQAGMGDEFWQFRPAQPTDSRRRIDWRRSARADSHFVRQTEWQAAQSVLLWVDEGLSMRFTGHKDRPEKATRARLLGRAAAILLIRAGERVGLAKLADRPQTGETQLIRLAEALTTLEGEEDHGAPRARTMPAGSRALFVSDFLGDLAPIERALMQAADRGVGGALCQVLDPVEEAFPFDGRTIFESVSGKVSHETLKASGLRDRYLERLAERKAQLAALARETGWQYSCHHTDEPAQAALLWIYGALERVR
ncbi:MAG TPA: DUF58 domain-containing protein [Aliiroseovarius sp.]|nr:DUF58 domain-containing protein [Aliiroseovarius sp.]